MAINIVSSINEKIASSPNVVYYGGVSEAEIVTVEHQLCIDFPDLMKRWLLDFGVVLIQPETDLNPFLHLLGLGSATTLYDNLLLFNDPNNPSRPVNYLVFAHEFDGEDDIIYALTPESNIASVTNWFALPYQTNKENWSEGKYKWVDVYESIYDFWTRKIEKYLSM